MANPNPSHGGLEAMRHLKSVDPPQFLSPSPELSQAARLASQFTFSSLKPHTPKSPFDSLLTDGFDAEQIWQQIDIQSQPLISSLGRQLRRFEKNPDEIARLFEGFVAKSERIEGLERESEGLERESEDFDGLERENEAFEGLDDDEDDDDEEGGSGGIEDKFLKIKELEEYLEAKEDEEYGLEKKKRKGGGKALSNADEEEEEEDGEDDEEDDDDDDDELEMFGGIGDGREGDEELGKERYEDFFSNKRKAAKRKSDLIDGSEDSETDDEQEDDRAIARRENEILSTHEKQQEELRSEIEKMEKANLEPKSWTMRGEVTAATRPKNSALEVDLDFEHNVRPAPVITEEVTASLEELIQKRILEGRFDDVQKAPSLSAQPLKQLKEMDETKSKKGLAEIYEEEYAQKINPTSAPLSFSDEQKKEASMLFKRLCLKLDALSHFHFAPKPVIEDMSIQANVPALAMEEIAPVAVSDAAMLAPEEVFAGEGDIKEETELTQAERKRRRANKKRKFKAETAKRASKKAARDSTLLNYKEEGKEKE